jgi:hypothetical protein
VPCYDAQVSGYRYLVSLEPPPPPSALSVAHCSSAQIVRYSEQTSLTIAQLVLEGMASGSGHALSLTPSMGAQRVTNNESEELLMMFSTSPEPQRSVHTARHTGAVWPLFDNRDEHERLPTEMTNKNRDYTRSTSAEISGLSYNSYATPMSELFGSR